MKAGGFRINPLSKSFKIMWKTCVLPPSAPHSALTFRTPEPPPHTAVGVVLASSMATFDKRAEGSPRVDDLPEERLQLHVRCVPEEDKVQLYLALGDGSVVTLNRCVRLRARLDFRCAS